MGDSRLRKHYSMSREERDNKLNRAGLDIYEVLFLLASEVVAQHSAVKGPLSTKEQRELELGGAAAKATRVEVLAANILTQIDFQRVYESGLTVAEAAERLDVTSSRIRQLICEGSLYAIGSNDQRRLPAFQFTDEGALPNLNKVLNVMGAWNPMAVVTFFLTTNEELACPVKTAMSPAEWLARGGAVVDILRLAEA